MPYNILLVFDSENVGATHSNITHRLMDTYVQYKKVSNLPLMPKISCPDFRLGPKDHEEKRKHPTALSTKLQTSQADAMILMFKLNPKEEEKDRKRIRMPQFLAKAPTKSLLVQLWFDGGSRGNPGISGAGAHLIVSTTSQSNPEVEKDLVSSLMSTTSAGSMEVTEKVVNVRYYCGPRFTNNYAEYCGLREGLMQAKKIVDEFCSAIDRTSPCTSSKEEERYRIEVDVKGDSMLVVNQMNGKFACKAAKLKKLNEECVGLVKDIKDKRLSKRLGASSVRALNDSSDSEEYLSVVVRYEHVYRENNKVADALANEAMEARRSWKT